MSNEEDSYVTLVGEAEGLGDIEEIRRKRQAKREERKDEELEVQRKIEKKLEDDDDSPPLRPTRNNKKLKELPKHRAISESFSSPEPESTIPTKPQPDPEKKKRKCLIS